MDTLLEGGFGMYRSATARAYVLVVLIYAGQKVEVWICSRFIGALVPGLPVVAVNAINPDVTLI